MRTRILAAAVAAVALTALTACGGDADEAEQAGAADDLAPLATEPPPDLDPEASRADTPAGPVGAERAQGETYVGEATDELSIALALEEGADAGGPQDALVYMCDGTGGGYLTGELGAGTTTLGDGALAVDVTLDEGSVSGAVRLDGGESLPFTASEADGVAGLYGAEFAHEGFDYRPVWVVLPDGTQRGGACWQCCSGEGCQICCPAPADVAGPTVDPEPETWWQRWFRK